MTAQEREAVQLLAVLGLVLSIIVLLHTGVGLFLTFAFGLWIHAQWAKAQEAKESEDKTWWSDD